MEITYFCKNLSKRQEAGFMKYVEEKRDSIAALLTKFAEDARLLKASIEKFEKHDAYEVEFNMQLPTKSLVAKEASHTMHKAVDLCKDRLITQIKKHMAMLRKDRVHQSIREPQKSKVSEAVSEFELS